MEKKALEKDNLLLEIADLSVEYTVNKSTVKAVNNLSLEVGHGECVGLVGETGAGKTTTALAVMRLVPNPPGKIVSGSIKFEGEDIISDGVCFGSIQVTNGQPIVMMADHQTVGGYPKIGCVITADLPLLAQLRAGDSVQFLPIGIETAQSVYLEQVERLKELMQRLDMLRSKPERHYNIIVNGKSYHVSICKV